MTFYLIGSPVHFSNIVPVLKYNIFYILIELSLPFIEWYKNLDDKIIHIIYLRFLIPAKYILFTLKCRTIKHTHEPSKLPD